MLFARVFRLDEGDTNLFEPAAKPGERATPGTFVREKFRLVPPQKASIEAFAVHGDGR